MSKWPVFILLIFTLASCSTFSRMKYRHIHKVPATPAEYAAPAFSDVNETVSGMSAGADTQVVVAAVIDVETPIKSDEGDSSLATEDSVQKIVAVHTSQKLSAELQLRLKLKPDLPPDLQLFFGILFIITALLVLLTCIFTLPYLGWSWFWIVLLEVIMLYAAWRLINKAIAFFGARFGKDASYKER